MITSTWLNSTHTKTKFYGITPQNVFLIAEKKMLDVSVTHRFSDFLTFPSKLWYQSIMKERLERGTHEYFLIKNV